MRAVMLIPSGGQLGFGPVILRCAAWDATRLMGSLEG